MSTGGFLVDHGWLRIYGGSARPRGSRGWRSLPGPNRLQEPCQPVQDKRARHSHVEAGPGADHRDLDSNVD